MRRGALWVVVGGYISALACSHVGWCLSLAACVLETTPPILSTAQTDTHYNKKGYSEKTQAKNAPLCPENAPFVSRKRTVASPAGLEHWVTEAMDGRREALIGNSVYTWPKTLALPRRTETGTAAHAKPDLTLPRPLGTFAPDRNGGFRLRRSTPFRSSEAAFALAARPSPQYCRIAMLEGAVHVLIVIR